MINEIVMEGETEETPDAEASEETSDTEEETPDEE